MRCRPAPRRSSPWRERYTHGPLPADRRRRDRRRGVRALRDRASPARPAPVRHPPPPGSHRPSPANRPRPARAAPSSRPTYRRSVVHRYAYPPSTTPEQTESRSASAYEQTDTRYRGLPQSGGRRPLPRVLPPRQRVPGGARPGPRGPLRRGRRPGPGRPTRRAAARHPALQLHPATHRFLRPTPTDTASDSGPSAASIEGS